MACAKAAAKRTDSRDEGRQLWLLRDKVGVNALADGSRFDIAHMQRRVCNESELTFVTWRDVRVHVSVCFRHGRYGVSFFEEGANVS